MSRKRPATKTESSSSDSEYEWKQFDDLSKHQTNNKISTQEHSWITDVGSMDSFLDMFTSKSTKDSSKKNDSLKNQPSVTKELNPYWKDGGCGIPKQTTSDRSSKSKLTQDNRSWLLKSFNRCLEQAQKTGTDLKTLLLERWDEQTVMDMLKTFGRDGETKNKFINPSEQVQDYYQSTSCRISEYQGHNQARWRKPGTTVSSCTDLSKDDQCIPILSEKHSIKNECASNKSQVSEVIQPDNPHITFEERMVTNEDLNNMAAKLMRAELGGNSTKIQKLKANLEKLREAMHRGLKVRLQTTRKSVSESQPVEAVVLTHMSDKGSEFPTLIPNLSKTAHHKNRSKSYQTHDSSGNRIAYFPDDNKDKKIADLIREERLCSAGNMDLEFSKLVARASNRADDEYSDAFVQKRSHAEKEAHKHKQDAIAAYKRRAFAESSCSICLERVSKHLIVSFGQKVFLSLPANVSMVPGYCLLTPYEHTGSTTRVDEDTIKELQLFKHQLCSMFKKCFDGSGCVFIETALKLDSPRYHTQIECVPISNNYFTSLPAYFKKAFSELGSEWDQNKRLISLKSGGSGAYGSIPPKFPYIAIEFGISDGGLARVIDNIKDIPSYFGREIIAGILELDTDLWRRPKPESFDRQRRKIVFFEECWHQFDKWTKEVSSKSPADIDEKSPSEFAEMEPEGPCLPPNFSE